MDIDTLRIRLTSSDIHCIPPVEGGYDTSIPSAVEAFPTGLGDTAT